MKTSTAYASGWAHAILIAAAFGCGGGGGGEATAEDDAQEPTRYVPAKDYLLPVPVEWGRPEAAFEALIRGNLVEAQP